MRRLLGVFAVLLLLAGCTDDAQSTTTTTTIDDQIELLEAEITSLEAELAEMRAANETLRALSSESKQALTESGAIRDKLREELYTLTARLEKTEIELAARMATESQTVQVAFASSEGSDCADVIAFDRTVDIGVAPIEAAFQLLVGGPTAQETAEGAGSYFSAQTAGTVRSVTLDDGLLTVDFDDFRLLMNNASTSCGSESLIAQLNTTAFQFPEVSSVQYQIDGNCDTFYNWLQRACMEYTRP